MNDRWKRMRGERLCRAASGGNVLQLQKLIEHEGYSVEGERHHGETALHSAVRHLQATACMYLMQVQCTHRKCWEYAHARARTFVVLTFPPCYHLSVVHRSTHRVRSA
jgi:hypothetical protein